MDKVKLKNNFTVFHKIYQDSWSKKAPKYPTRGGGVLHIKGFIRDLLKKERQVIVECSLCKKDPVLNGKAIYLMYRSNLLRGEIPCSCAFNPKFKVWQQGIRHIRICEEKGYRFIRLVKGRSGWAVEVQCPKDDFIFKTSIDNLKNNHGCPLCAKRKITKDQSQSIQKFFSTGNFLEGTVFCKTEIKAGKRQGYLWRYKCPVCSNDEYVKAGVCAGVFEAREDALYKGSLSCRCAKTPHFTKEQREFKIKEIMHKEGSDYDFIGWCDRYKNNNSKFCYRCVRHGEKTSSISNFMGGRRCRECIAPNQTKAYIHLVLDNDLPLCLKFGVASNIQRRKLYLSYQTTYKIENMFVYEFDNAYNCRAAESFCKSSLDCSFLTRMELNEGHTETTSISNLDVIIEIFEDYGGIKV